MSILPPNYAEYAYLLPKFLDWKYSVEFKDNKISITNGTLTVVYTVYKGGSWSAIDPPNDIDDSMVRWVKEVNEMESLYH